MENSLSKISLLPLSTSRPSTPHPLPRQPPYNNHFTNQTPLIPEDNEKVTTPSEHVGGEASIPPPLEKDAHNLGAATQELNGDGFDLGQFAKLAQRVLNVKDEESVWELAGLSLNLVRQFQNLESFSNFTDFDTLQFGKFRLDEGGKLIVTMDEKLARRKVIETPLILEGENLNLAGEFCVDDGENLIGNKVIEAPLILENSKSKEEEEKEEAEKEGAALKEVQIFQMEEEVFPVEEERHTEEREEEQPVEHKELVSIDNYGGTYDVSINYYERLKVGFEKCDTRETKDAIFLNFGEKFGEGTGHVHDKRDEDYFMVNCGQKSSNALNNCALLPDNIQPTHGETLFMQRGDNGYINYDSIGGSSQFLNHLASFPNKEQEREESSTHEGDFSIQQETTCIDSLEELENHGHLADQMQARGQKVEESGCYMEDNKKRELLNISEWVSGESSTHGDELLCWKKERKEDDACASDYCGARLEGKEDKYVHYNCEFQNQEEACVQPFNVEKDKRETRGRPLKEKVTCDDINIQRSEIQNSKYEFVNGDSLAHGEDFSYEGKNALLSAIELKKKEPLLTKGETGHMEDINISSQLIPHTKNDKEDGRKIFQIGDFGWKRVKNVMPISSIKARRLIKIDEQEEKTQEGPTHEHTPGRKNPDTITEGFHTSNRRTLHFVAPESQNGIPIVKPKKETIEEGAKKWSATAIGYLLGKKPYFYHLQSFVRNTWKGIKEIIAAANGFYLFLFDTEDLMEDVVQGGPWLFNGQPIFLQRWHPGMNMERQKHTHVPVWIKLKNLPLEYWTSEGLSVVASGVGQPLYPDSITRKCSRIDYARVCVLIDMERPLPKEETINSGRY